MSLYEFGGLVVFHAIQYHINNSHAKKITNAPTAQEAFLLRQSLKDARKILAIIFAIIFAFVYYLMINSEEGNSELAVKWAVGAFFYCLITMLISPSYYKSIDSISVNTIEEYQKNHPRYALF